MGHPNDDSYNRIRECDVEFHTAPIGFQMEWLKPDPRIYIKVKEIQVMRVSCKEKDYWSATILSNVIKDLTYHPLTTNYFSNKNIKSRSIKNIYN